MSPAQRLVVRPARTSDVRAIRSLVDTYAPDRRLLSKATVTLYEGVPEFIVGELDGVVVACGAVHVMWEDLAEVRTVAVDPALRGQGGVEINFLDVTQVDQDSPERAAFALLECQRFNHLIARDFAQFGEHAADAATFEFQWVDAAG